MGPDWDWQKSVEVYGAMLAVLLADLFVRLGMAVDGSGTPGTVTRMVRLSVLEVLRPLEAALRRVIVMAARGIALPDLPNLRKRATGPKRKAGDRASAASDQPLPFPLFDPRMKLGMPPRRKGRRGAGPRMTEIGVDTYVAYVPPPLPQPDDEMPVDMLARRMRGVMAALEDIPAQARRLTRAIARLKAKGSSKQRPMRPGRPSGHRARGKRPIDLVLADCQYLALWALVDPVKGSG